MANPRVDRPNTVNIDRKSYIIEGDVSRKLASTFPRKFVTGEYSEESHPFISTITWEGFSGGQLKEIGDFPGDEGRSFSGGLNGRIPFHLTMPPPQSGTGGTDTAFIGKYTHIQEYQGTIYSHAAVDSVATLSSEGIYRVTTNSNQFVVGTGPGRSVTDLHSGYADGLAVLVSANSTAINWTHSDTDDATWLSIAAGAEAAVTWRDKLWFANESGELSFVDDAADTAEGVTQVAQARLTDTGQVYGLLVDDNDELYMVAKNGLHLYNNEAEHFLHVLPMNLPNSSVVAFTAGNGSIYLGSAPSIRRYTRVDGANVVDEIGLDRDDGIASSFGTHGLRFAGMTVDGPDLFVVTKPASGGQIGIFGLRGDAWHQVHLSSGGKGSTATTIITSSGKLYSGVTNTNGTMLVPSVSNLFQNVKYLPSVGSTNDELVLPWVVAQNEQQWLATSVRTTHKFLDFAGSGTISDNDIITLSYGVNLNQDSFTAIGTIKGTSDSDGSKVFSLPSEDGDGVPFSAFRLKIEMRNTGGLTSPDLNQLSLSIHKNLDPLWGFQLVIDATKQGFGRSAKEVREELKALFEKDKLFRFTFKGDAGEEESYFVTAIDLQSAEGTGTDQSGQYLLSLAEVN